MYRPFWKVWLVYFLVAGVSLLVLVVQQVFPGNACSVGSTALPWTQCYLGASTSTPWGIVTGLFVHTSFWFHYLPNMVLLFAVVFVFCVTNVLQPGAEKAFRQRAFIGLMFLSAIVANAASLLYYGPVPTVGASGLDLATLGIVLVFCAYNALPRRRTWPESRFASRDSLDVITATFNGLLAAGLAVLALLEPVAFLSVRPNVDVVAHVFSFIFAVGATAGCLLGHPRPSRIRVRWPIES